MQLCKKLCFSAPLCTVLLYATYASTFLYAQQTPVSAPVITAPSAPEAPTAPFIEPPELTVNPAQANRTQPNRFQKKSKTNVSSNAVQSGAAVQTSAALTASDLNLLSSLLPQGILPAVTEQSGSNLLTNAVQNGQNSQSGQMQTAVLLNTVIEKLDTILAAVKKTNAENVQTGTSEASRTNTKTAPIKQNARVLRFNSGTYNILQTCTAVFVSEAEDDGSFLFTGDRTYRTMGKEHSETFYILFKAVNRSIFNVSVTVRQNEENRQSALYRLSQIPLLTASRTGNLVSLHTNSQDFAVDLLLSVDFKTAAMR